MVNAGIIQNKLNGLIGLRNPFNPAYAVLDSANTSSRSGLYVTDNEFVKVEHLKDCQDYADISDADFNTFLQNKQKESITSVCNAVFNKPDFIDRGMYYNYAINKFETIDLPVGFVGYKIKVAVDQNIAVSIKRVLLDFEGTGTIKLMLFNTSQLDPLETETINITTDHQEVVLDWVVDNTGGIFKGDYYIGYLTDGIGVKPYSRDFELANVVRQFTHLDIEEIQVIDHSTEKIFDSRLEESMDDATGLNMDITVYDDYTDLITNNESLFAVAINYDMQISCLSTVIASDRSNRTERSADRNIVRMMAEIEGQSGEGQIKITGLRPLLVRSIGMIRNEIEKLRSGYFGEKLFTDTLS